MGKRSYVGWWGGKIYGYEDFGVDFEDDSNDLATQALVFL